MGQAKEVKLKSLYLSSLIRNPIMMYYTQITFLLSTSILNLLIRIHWKTTTLQWQSGNEVDYNIHEKLLAIRLWPSKFHINYIRCCKQVKQLKPKEVASI